MNHRLLAPALALSACATTSAPAAALPDSITYETGPCFGACPVYRFTVSRDGSGTFEGRRFTGVIGTRSFRVTPDEFEAFARHLEPVRPASGTVRYSGEACEVMATDLPSAEVTWHAPDGSEQGLYFYYGCDMEANRALAQRLEAAPTLLPIAPLITPRIMEQ